MPDSFTEVTTTGYGNRVMNAFKGIIGGFILLVIAVYVLYGNEAKIDLSKIARTATSINAEQVNSDAKLNEKLVSVTGDAHSEQIIGDDMFLNPGKFIVINRVVQMYSWVEDVQRSRRENYGGSETTTTTYTYNKNWEESPRDSSKFKHPEGHYNPGKALNSDLKSVKEAEVGVYKFDPAIASLPNLLPLMLNAVNLQLSGNAILGNSNYIFVKKSESGTFMNPQIGDLRISYKVLYSGFNATIFGKLNGDRIIPYDDVQKGISLYALRNGTREQAILALHSEYLTDLWTTRLIGFLLMLVGFSAIFSPLSVILSIIPFIGALSRSIINAITFLLALVFTVITILISIIVHNVAAFIFILIVLVAVVSFIILRHKAKINNTSSDELKVQSNSSEPTNSQQASNAAADEHTEGPSE